MDEVDDHSSKSESTTNETILKPKTKPEKSQPVSNFFNQCTDYDLENFTKFNLFTKWLHRPVDGAALGVFRMLYGAAMLIDIAEERGGSQMDVRFGEAKYCHFPLMDGIGAFSFPIMGCVYMCMWLGAIGIMIGYRFRLSCLAFIVPYWYIFLLDKPAWNNHSYLFGLVGSILLFTQANRYCSLDKYFIPNLPTTVPYWNYFLIKFQFFILYMYAGLKKLTAEWLSGYAMSSLSRHWVLSPFRWFLTEELVDLLIVHWFTAIFDFSIAFLMTCSKTRVFATPFMISFHLMNSRLFVIGMFPWVCLAQVPIFYGCGWPRKISLDNFKKLYKSADKQIENDRVDVLKTKTQNEAIDTNDEEPIVYCNACKKIIKTNCNSINFGEQSRTFAILFYCGLQLFLPYSHFITQGYNNWTNGLYGYSWDMMVHSYDTILTTIKVVDNGNSKVHYLDPYAFTEYDRWTKYADMAQQYAHCIHKNIEQEHRRNTAQSPLSSTNISIYFDIWCSMNGRFQQRVFDPRVDLLKAEWSLFKRTSWSLPLINELNHLRPKLRTIANEVLAWSNFSDVIFVADFPGLTLDNFISPDLTNVSLTILEGNVRYFSDKNVNDTFFLTSGNSISLTSNTTHHVSTIGLKPSCYLFTYSNKTMEDENIVIENSIDGKQMKSLLPLWQELLVRIDNYKRFLQHMGNCILYLLYGVPIPMEVRERN